MDILRSLFQIVPHAEIAPAQIPAAIAALRQRIEHIRSTSMLDNGTRNDLRDAISRLCTLARATYRHVFGENTIEAYQSKRFEGEFTLPFYFAHPYEYLEAFDKGRVRLVSEFETQILLLEEKLSTASMTATQRALQAYSDLDLHPTIAQIAGDLYRNGHYANAIEDAVNSPLTKSRMRDSFVTEQLALDSDGIGSAAGSSIGDAGDVVRTAALAWPRVL
jgi:citrate synthase